MKLCLGNISVNIANYILYDNAVRVQLYIYIYIARERERERERERVIHKQTVSLYHNFSMWLDTCSVKRMLTKKSRR